VVFCLAVWLTVAVRAADEPTVLTPDNPSAFASLSRLTQLLDALQKNYVQPLRVSPGQHIAVALRAYVRAVDPEAELLTAEEAASTNAAGSADIGLSFAVRDDFPVVIASRDDSPAQDAGLLPGDQLVAIDNQPLCRARRVEVQQLLRGPPDSPVTLRVLDPATRVEREVRLRRAARTSSPGVVLKFVARRIAYCRVPEFTQTTAEALHTAMGRAREERAPGVVLDLRNNAGGAFDAAQVAVSLFLPAGAPIAALDYAEPSQRTTFVSDEAEKFTVPLVVLVDGGTAAEAEMFAAALQDNNRAQIVGSKTFGRGLLTKSVTLGDGSVLSVPTAYYLRPSKQILQGAGLRPDVTVEVPRETERLLVHFGFSTFNWVNDRTAVLKTDRALARALSLLPK
jgi:carboxyl-terminal processing protease